jgi:thymidylate synthase (FAD)
MEENMTVKLISYTQVEPETFLSLNNDETTMSIIGKNVLKTPTDLIAFCARVSNPSNQMNNQTSEKLLEYMIRNHHWSPFEMASACLEITTTRDIARQILRHRSFYFQEFSQRYANPLESMNFVLREARLQDEKNRQNSIPTDDDIKERSWLYSQYRVIEAAKDAYNKAIQNGIAKEQARAVLPEGLTESRLYMHGTFRSWFHYVQLRSANGTQKEHRDVALECAKALEPVFPFINKALLESV